ncbi:MAG: PHP domain-containing protein [Lachnospiraceae bacterium]|nr:PHP domain-containing protein [Lachnospiraceae bacterium]
MYKIETHLHTTYSSKCGWLEAEELIAGYKAAGYSGIVVTDHFNRTTFDYLQIDLASEGDKVHPFLEGYHRMKEEGRKQGIQIYKGAELRFDECNNDYLLFGYHNELLRNPEEIFRMGIAAFAPLCRAAGALLIQAHPYRRGCTPAIACYLDGVEVLNGSPRHDSHNDRAAEYAEQFGLIGTAGSDCHRPEDIGVTGILAEHLPENSIELTHLLRSGKFSLLETKASE